MQYSFKVVSSIFKHMGPCAGSKVNKSFAVVFLARPYPVAQLRQSTELTGNVD